MTPSNEEYLTDSEYDEIVLWSRNHGYTLDMFELYLNIISLKSRDKEHRREGEPEKGYPLWVQAMVLEEVYVERNKVEERSRKIAEFLSDSLDTAFVDSLDIDSLFGE
ncbi:hypothetical protein [Rufibacter tibetensis]|uniref:Uncharacterized protein n=1 Tax=Rufibacter tibetensis TaxID=512763 RepID=A0A0P0D0W9_9BACT|nr:hypothetical protein [Rufibacter tibetensis]ALJ00695.1 hypothetical protein DC20_19075 [Rufibacter tibetensis]